MSSPMDWLAMRTPPAPDELKAWLSIPDGGTDHDGGAASVTESLASVTESLASVTESLVKAGLLHLEDAVGRPGQDREAAYQLLAADALITYGCEAASEAADVRGVLREVLGRVGTGRAVT